MKRIPKRPPANKRKAHGNPKAPLRQPSAMEVIHRLIDDENYEEAFERLLELEVTEPDNVEVVVSLMMCAVEMELLDLGVKYAAHLQKLEPDDPLIHVQVLATNLAAMRAASVTRMLEEFDARWPDLELPEDMREAIELFTNHVLETFGPDEPRQVSMAKLGRIEEAEDLFNSGEFEQSKSIVQSVLDNDPAFKPALAFMSTIAMADGDLPAAYAAVKKITEFDPDDDQAQCSLLAMARSTGHYAEMKVVTERLKSMIGQEDVDVHEVAIALTTVGEYEAVLTAYSAAMDDEEIEEDDYLFCHIAGVAAASLGDREAARELWEQAVDASDDADISRWNLADMDKPEGSRFGPVAFGAGVWLSPLALDDLLDLMEAVSTTTAYEAGQLTRAVLASRPEIIHAAPSILLYGDPPLLMCILAVAAMSHDARFAEPVWGFVTGQRGSDVMRRMALEVLRKLGQPIPEAITYYSKGIKTELVAANIQFAADADARDLSPAAIKALNVALDQFRLDKFEEAEKTLRYALQLAPGNPRVLYTLANTLGNLLRLDESNAVRDDLARTHPEYPTIRVDSASSLLRSKNPDEARAILKSLRGVKEMSDVAFRKYCKTWAELLERDGNRKEADKWRLRLTEFDNTTGSKVPERAVDLGQALAAMAKGMQ